MRRVQASRLLVLLAVLALVLPSTNPAESQQKGVIKIATQSPVTGDLSPLAEGIRQGAQLAIDRLKNPVEKLGFKVELILFDDQGRPDVGVANARNIVADKNILAVIGTLTADVDIPSSEIYREFQLAMISPADINPKLTERKYPNVNRVVGRSDVQGMAAAEFAQSLKIRTAYVIHDKTAYGEGTAESFRDNAKKLGIQVIGFEGTGEKFSFDTLIAQIKTRSPDLIYFGGSNPQVAPFLKQARDRGVKSQFLGPAALDPWDLVKMAGRAVVGMEYTDVSGPVANFPMAKDFIGVYKGRFRRDPEALAAYSYDATAIALKAIEVAIRDAGGNIPLRQSVSAAIRKIRYTGITGDIEFDAIGDRKKAPYFVLQVPSDDPAKWYENKAVRLLNVGTGGSGDPCFAGTCTCTGGTCKKECCKK